MIAPNPDNDDALSAGQKMVCERMAAIFNALTMYPECEHDRPIDVAMKIAGAARSLIEMISQDKLTLAVIFPSEEKNVKQMMLAAAERLDDEGNVKPS